FASRPPSAVVEDGSRRGALDRVFLRNYRRGEGKSRGDKLVRAYRYGRVRQASEGRKSRSRVGVPSVALFVRSFPIPHSARNLRDFHRQSEEEQSYSIRDSNHLLCEK